MSVLSPTQVVAQPEKTKDQNLLVQQLIQQLDSPRYDQRQSAMAQLKDLGADAIKPLAEKLIDGTPESCARIKQILPAIAMRSGRDELFQVLAVLNLRFNVDFQELNTLVSKWTVSRRQFAIEKLRESGAEVVDEFDGSEDLRQAQLRVARMIAVEPRPNLLPPGLPQGGIQIQIRMGDQKKIEIGGDQLKQFGKPKLGQPDSEQAVDPKKRPDNVAIEVALAKRLKVSAEENERWLLARTEGSKFLNADATSSQLPIKVILSSDWNGRLEALDQTITISELVFKEIQLTPKLFVPLSKQSVQRVIFENCLLSAGEGKFQLPAGLRSIVVQQSGGASELLGKLADDQLDVFQLKLVGGDAQQPLDESILGFRSIFNLELENFDLDERSFDQIAKLSKLKMLTLSRCKFAPADYRKYDLARQTVRKTFTGKALLGVRGIGGGLIGPGLSSCQVTDVVAGTAADQAGVEAGDIIVGIGKHSVKEFADLRLLIAGYDIGDEVEIKVQRGGKTLDLKAKLGDAQAVDPF